MNATTLSFVFAVMVLCSACCSCSRSPNASGEPLAMTPLADGAGSAIRTEQLTIVRDLEAWRALWDAHTATQLPRPELPAVNFDEEMVVAVFLGERTSGGYGVAIEACTPDGETVTVVARETAPAADSMQATVMTAPFAFVCVPRADGTGVLDLVRP